jgi:TRAP-type uncharacterized transport system fused permease subunit
VPIAAHLFAFYFGLVSAITPPVALASFAASGIADSNPMQTGIQSFLIGLAKYVIPIVFIYNPGILIVGDAYHIVWGIAGGFLGIFSLTLTVVGFLYVRMSWLGRVLAAASAVLLFHPSATSDFGGVVGLALLVGYYYFKSKRLPQEEPG